MITHRSFRRRCWWSRIWVLQTARSSGLLILGTNVWLNQGTSDSKKFAASGRLAPSRAGNRDGNDPAVIHNGAIGADIAACAIRALC